MDAVKFYRNDVSAAEQQADGNWPVVECDPSEDRCEPFHEDEVNILNIIKRFSPVGSTAGYVQPPGSVPVHDFDMDFQSSQNLVLEAAEAFNSASEAVRSLFGSVDGLLTSLASGEAILRDGEIFVPTPEASKTAKGDGTGQGEAAAGSVT